MFERFSDNAHEVVSCAQEEARRLVHPCLEAEHLLLGVLRHHEGAGAEVLLGQHLSLGTARRIVDELRGRGEKPVDVDGSIGFGRTGKDALEGALRICLELGHEDIGDEHILLALLERRAGIATRVLGDAGLDRDKVQRELVRRLGFPSTRTDPRDLAAELSRALAWAARKAGAEGRTADTGDLLTGLVAADPLAARAAAELDVDEDDLRAAVARARRQS